MSGDIKPGVYLDLTEKEYFAVDALGSTDLKALERDPLDWWAGSRLNPSVYTPKPRADANDSLALGKAIHTLLLEGPERFRTVFSVEPPWDSPSDRNIEAMRQALKAKDVRTEITIPVADVRALCRQHGIASKEDLKARHEIELQTGKLPLAWNLWKRVEAVARALEGDNTLEFLRTNGLSEVSVFWHREAGGPLLRARFDRLLPRFTVDLKTITPWEGGPFQGACLEHVAKYRYDIQVEVYREARIQAASLPVIGGTRVDRALLKKLLSVPHDPTGEEGWTPMWMFVQPPADEQGRGRALKVEMIVPELGGAAWEPRAARARASIDTGLANFARCQSDFPAGAPWRAVNSPWAPAESDWGRLLKDWNA